MPRLIITLLILGGVGYFIFRIIYEFLGGISGGKSAIERDIAELETYLNKYQLAPWQHDEIDLISRRHEVKNVSQLYAYIDHGQFFSIYDEPILAFAIKEYKENDRRVAAVKINKEVYHFKIAGDLVEMSQKGEKIGKVSIVDGLKIKLYGHNLHIDSNSESGLIPLSIDKEVKLAIASGDDDVGHAGRMLHKINDHTKSETELILVSIAFALVNKQI